MKVRKLHRLMGTILILPMLAWGITGLIFFLKPGYKDAFAPLPIKTYPMESPAEIPVGPYREIRTVRTILGLHHLAKSDAGTEHWLNGSLLEKPDKDQIHNLVQDAIFSNHKRYGDIADIDNFLVVTETGVRINVNWNDLSLYQTGKDTDRINWYYKVHYLQWTGHEGIDKILGIGGLVLLYGLTFCGIWLLKPRKS